MNVANSVVPPTVSADGLPTWQINGVVWSQVVVNNIVYATGSFTKARPPGVAAGGPGEVDAQNIFAYDITTGQRVSTFNHSLNAQGLAIAASPDGSRVYVGGDFTAVDGIARGHVASFQTASGALDLNFAPKVQGQVTALAVASTKVFVGGAFGTVNGQSRQSLAAVDAINGSALTWAPTVDNGKSLGDGTGPRPEPRYRRRLIHYPKWASGLWHGVSRRDHRCQLALGGKPEDPRRWRRRRHLQPARRQHTNLRHGLFLRLGNRNFEGTFAANPSTGAITVVNDCHGDTYDVLPLGGVIYSVGHAHDCSWIRSFPDTNPRVRWQRALAQTIAPFTTNIGPDNYGWNYNGMPASKVLHWFPQLPGRDLHRHWTSGLVACWQ